MTHENEAGKDEIVEAVSEPKLSHWPQTKTLKFQGYGDDTFGYISSGLGVVVVYIDKRASGDPIRMRVSAPGEALIVSGQYFPGACAGWLIGISPAAVRSGNLEERHISAWPMRFERSDREYSPLLIIEAPANVMVELIDEKGRSTKRDYIDV